MFEQVWARNKTTKDYNEHYQITIVNLKWNQLIYKWNKSSSIQLGKFIQNKSKRLINDKEKNMWKPIISNFKMENMKRTLKAKLVGDEKMK